MMTYFIIPSRNTSKRKDTERKKTIMKLQNKNEITRHYFLPPFSAAAAAVAPRKSLAC